VGEALAMTRRTDRVADAIQEEIARLLLREIKDPRVGMITLTGVRVSADLRHARVLFSVFGEAERREEALAGLRSASGFVRTQLARRLNLRVVPEIVFEADTSLEEAQRVSRLLKEKSTGGSDS
jgi:ribosome-binding factor A